jgi:hypothetical protein
MTGFEFIILALATWRLSSLLVNEEGPFSVFTNLRYLAGVRFDEYSQSYGKNVVADALQCVWCASVWIAIIWFAAWLLFGAIATTVAIPFALSAVACIVEERDT